MDNEVTVCDICGDVGREDLLAICNKCTDGAEHIYCMRVKLDKVPEGDWICEECMVESECQKSESPVNLGSRGSSRLKFKPSHAGKRQTERVHSTSHLPAKRRGVPLKAQSVKKGRVNGMSAESSRSSRTCKDFIKGKVKATKNITSELQISCNSQGRVKVPPACGDKRHACIVEAKSAKKRTPKTRVTFPAASKPSNQSLPSREPAFKKLGKAKLEAARSVSSVKQSSCGFQEKPKLPKSSSQTEIARDKCALMKSRSSKTADLKFKGQLAKDGGLQKQKVERNLSFDEIRKGKNPAVLSKSVSFNSASSEQLNTTCSEIIIAKTYHPLVFKNSNSAEETKTAKGKNASELHNPATCLLASDSGVTTAKGENKTVSRDETSFSGSNCGRIDAVQSCGLLDCRLQPNSHDTYKDLNCLNEENKSKSQQAEPHTEAPTAVKVHKLCASLGSDERSQFEEAFLSEDFVVAKPDYIWLGKFQIQRSEGIASTCIGIQAHLSTCASQKVLEVVGRLPEILVLEELPRWRICPSQFVESQATEENIALYFFAKDIDRTYYRRLMEYMIKNDLALKGNLDGVELLIFPSNVLPEKSQRWNSLLFLWGVFREQMVNNSANTPLLSSQKRENRDIASSWALDLNAYSEDGNDIVRVDEIGQFDSICTRSGDIYNSGCSDSSHSLDGGKKMSESVLDLDSSLLLKSATPEDSPWMFVGNMGDKTNEDVQGKRPMEEKNNAENVEVHVNLPMEEENNANNVEVHGKLQMEEENIVDSVGVHAKLPINEKNNTDNVEPSRLPSLSPVLPTIYKENLDLPDRQAAEILVLLSKGLRKI